MLNSIIYDILLAIISLYILIKKISYGIYEIKEKENKTGGISVIVFSTLVVIFANIALLLN